MQLIFKITLLRKAAMSCAMALLLALCGAWSNAKAQIPLQASLLLPPSDGDGAAGDAFGFALASCGSDIYATVFADQVPNLGSVNGIVVGSVQRLQETNRGLSFAEKIQAITPIDEAYGASVACAADALFVGAITRSQGDRAQVGGVHYYVRESGALLPQGVLPSPEQSDFARFGEVLSVSARWLAVSAIGIGKVFVYERVGAALLLRQVISSPLGLERDFGRALGFDGDTLWVGMPAASETSGEARRYRLDSGAEIARLAGPRSFGASFAISQSGAVRLWIGAPDAGLGQVFAYASNLSLQQTLTHPDDALAPAGFGSAMAIRGTDLAIAAPRVPFASQAFIGAVYHFQLQGSQAILQRRFGPEQTSPPVASHAELFGAQLAFSQTGTLLISAWQANGSNLPLQGRLYAATLSSNASLTSIDTGRGLSFERFGQTMAADSAAIIVGVQSAASVFGPETGRAYIFERDANGFSFAQLLEPPDIVVEQRFGAAVAIQGDTAAVGSIWNVINGVIDAGSVYIFRRAANGWQFAQKLTLPEPTEEALFGSALSLSGDWLAIGARSQRLPFFDQGGVALFQRDSGGQWQFRQALQAPDGAAFDFFGGSVSLRGTDLLVGAPGARRTGMSAGGRTFWYRRIGEQWTLAHTLSDPNGSAGAAFGFALQLDEQGFALIGAPQQSQNLIPGTGAVLRFDRNATLLQRYAAPVLQADAFFGISLATRADGILIGASGQDSVQTDAGAAYWFPANSSAGQLIALSTQQQASFGRGVLLPPDASERLIGAPGLARANPQEGGIFIVGGKQSMSDFRDGFESR
jgi:hypothetical protein